MADIEALNSYLSSPMVLHPRYRTQLCNDGISCGRKICFFAHTMDELRVSSVKVPDKADAQEALYEDSSVLDPFRQSPQEVHKLLHQTLRMSPRSPMVGLEASWSDQSSSSSGGSTTDNPSRRTSLQLQGHTDTSGRINNQGRLSLDLFPGSGSRPNIGAQRMALPQMGGGRHSVDLLANEMHLQQLHLAAIQAQLQLQQAMQMQNLAVQQQQQQQQPSVDHLAQALAQLQMANGLATAGEPQQATLCAPMPNIQQQQQQASLAHAYMQQMLLQQSQQQQQTFKDLQRKLVQGQNSNVGSSNHLLDSSFSIPEDPDEVQSARGNSATSMGSPMRAITADGFAFPQTMA